MTKEEVLEAIKVGVIVAILTAALTAIITTYALYQNIDDGSFRLFNDWVSYLDVVMVLILAFYLNRKSRFAAIFLTLFFILNKVVIFKASSINAISIIVALVILYIFVKSTYATFAFHRIEKQENPDYKKPSKKLLYIFSPIILIIIIVLGFGISADSGSLEILKSKEISKSQIIELKKAEIILPSDKIDFLYSYGFDLLESGVALTPNSLIIFYTEEGQKTEVYRLNLSIITEIRLKEQGDYFNDSVYEILTNKDDSWLPIYLSTSLDRDKQFVKKIQDYISKY